jgi:hypothetical protein
MVPDGKCNPKVYANWFLFKQGEIHAAGIGLAHLSQLPDHSIVHLHWGLWGVLAASTLSKSVLATVSGGWQFGWRVASALLRMLAAIALTLVWFQPPV